MKRRDLLRSGLLAMLAGLLPLAGRPAKGMAEPGRYGRHYLVNGWVLTGRDLEAIARETGAGDGPRGFSAR